MYFFTNFIVYKQPIARARAIGSMIAKKNKQKTPLSLKFEFSQAVAETSSRNNQSLNTSVNEKNLN